MDQSMFFSDIKKKLVDANIFGKLKKKKIKFITDHSEEVNSNALLVINNNKKYKKVYLKKAINKGLEAIITNSYFKNIKITQIVVKDLDREILKLLNLRQSFNPKKSIAITGTNGKTSVAWYLAQICKYNKIPTKLTGTLGFYKDNKKVKNTFLTTPSNLELFQFANSNKRNNDIFISEASSHGLHQGRYNNVNIDIAAITNLSHDHLDYHKTFISYVESKMLLFTKVLNKNGTAVINSRLKNYKYFVSKIKSRNLKIITFGSKDVYFTQKKLLTLNILGKKYYIKDLKLNNIQKENLECAIACALAVKIKINNIIKTLDKLKSASGRFEEIIYKKKSSKIIIDYAHTPDAMQNVLKSYTNKSFKPSLVFGCGGERDKSKRKKMSIIASKYAKKVYLTDDNPRNENANLIRKTLKKYCQKARDISNRRIAIQTAISEMHQKDILIIAGKGHEKYQIIKDKNYSFDDFKVAKDFIK
jgi:UDP-N-acetylmuramyl-tripeptide synthetase